MILRNLNLFIVLLLTSCFYGCEIIKMDYVPEEEQIRNSFGSFLVKPAEVTGHYANMDIDCIFFTYRSEASDSADFWTLLDDALTEREWKCTLEDETQRHYERIFRKTGEQLFHSAEQMRISYNPETKFAVVAWVQADSLDPVERFSENDEASFAAKVVWPRFERLAADEKGTAKIE